MLVTPYLLSVLVEQENTDNITRSPTCEISNPIPRAEGLDNVHLK